MRDQIVIVNGAKSRIVKMLSGIVQGSCTAALCFLIFINDLPECVTQSFTGLFCDDTLLAKEIVSEKDTEALQADLNKVHDWSERWGREEQL